MMNMAAEQANKSNAYLVHKLTYDTAAKADFQERGARQGILSDTEPTEIVVGFNAERQQG